MERMDQVRRCASGHQYSHLHACRAALQALSRIRRYLSHITVDTTVLAWNCSCRCGQAAVVDNLPQRMRAPNGVFSRCMRQMESRLYGSLHARI